MIIVPKLNNCPTKNLNIPICITKSHTHTHNKTTQDPLAVCMETANSSERLGALNYLPPRTQMPSDKFAPPAILPCQELTIRHAKQVLYMNFAKVSLWENRTKTN